jgi:hypothetical protein
MRVLEHDRSWPIDCERMETAETESTTLDAARQPVVGSTRLNIRYRRGLTSARRRRRLILAALVLAHAVGLFHSFLPLVAAHGSARVKGSGGPY